MQILQSFYIIGLCWQNATNSFSNYNYWEFQHKWAPTHKLNMELSSNNCHIHDTNTQLIEIFLGITQYNCHQYFMLVLCNLHNKTCSDLSNVYLPVYPCNFRWSIYLCHIFFVRCLPNCHTFCMASITNLMQKFYSVVLVVSFWLMKTRSKSKGGNSKLYCRIEVEQD